MNFDTLQPLLGIDKSNPFFEILFNPKTPNELLVHFGMKLLEIVPRSSFQEKLLIARLFNAGFNQTELSLKFGYDRKTMRNWGYLLKSGKSEDIIKIGDGQGACRKLTDDRLQYIYYLFDKHYEEYGCHINTFIRNEYADVYKEKISNEAIRTKLLDKKRKFRDRQCDDNTINVYESISGDSENVYPLVLYAEERKIQTYFKNLSLNIKAEPITNSIKNEEKTCRNNIIPVRNIKQKCNLSPHLPISVENKFPVVTPVSELLSCHHIGILLTRFFLDFISENLGDISNIIRQWIAMIINGCQNIEQGQGLNYRAFELFIGKQKTSANKQRDELKSIANYENVNLLFKQNIRMIKAENDDTFLLDPHGVPYTGQLSVLKCWLGSSHTIGKGYYLDLIHTLRGEPVFSIIDDNYYDLRQRFLADIMKFRKVLGGDKNRYLTMVVDRAIYDVEFMKLARSKDIYIITWEKNYKKGQWKSNCECPVKTFFIIKYRNRKEDTYTYTVQYFKRKWVKEKSFTQIILLLSKPKQEPIELSVICTDDTRDAEKTLKPILTRWLQENDMGYLILLGINQITSYAYHSYEDVAETLTDRDVNNKEFTRLASEKIKVKKALGMLLVNRELYIEKKEQSLIAMIEEQIAFKEQINTENISDTQKLNGIKKLRKLNTKIKRLPKDKEKVLNNNLIKQNELRIKIKEFDMKLNDIPRKTSRIEAMIREEYVKLNFMPKTLMDAVKITARNIIYQLQEIFRPIWNNYRNDIVILRELISSMGHIEENKKYIIIKLNPARQYTKKEKHKILIFLFQISNLINKKYDLDKVIVISLYEL